MRSATEKLACVERELRMRRRAYPRWVASGRMTQQKADDEIAVMQEIAEDYRRLVSAVDDLFGGAA